MSKPRTNHTPSYGTGLFYGYVVVAAGLVILMTTFGLNYTFGIFFKPLIAEFGWSRAVVSGAYSIMTVVAGISGIVAGKLSDKFGPRIVSTVSGVFLGVGFMLMSLVISVWQAYLVYGLIVAAGTGACWPILMPLVPKWFNVRRGLMSGILSCGVSLGLTTIPPAASWLIYNVGWRTAYVIVGGGALTLIAVSAQFLKPDPRAIGQRPFGQDSLERPTAGSEYGGLDFKDAICTRQFAFVCTAYFCFGFCLHSVMVHIVPHATESGIPATTASSIISLIGLLGMAGRLIAGSTSDRLGVRISLIASFGMLFFAFVWLQFANVLWMFYLFGALFALAYGGVMAMQTLIIADLFGLRSAGALLGGVSFIYTTGGAAGPYVTGYLFDVTNTYNLAYLFTAALSLVGCGFASLLRRPSISLIHQ